MAIAFAGQVTMRPEGIVGWGGEETVSTAVAWRGASAGLDMIGF